MKKETDKEMDSLLRRLAETTARDNIAAVDTGSSHIDADEISVFAENALPVAARTRVISHIADCGRCRNILSNTIALRDEEQPADPAAAAGQTVPASPTPFYKKLFAVRSLAFGFGALAVLLAGFLGVTVLRNMTSSGDTSVAQLDNAIAANANTAATSVERDSLPADDAKSGTSPESPLEEADQMNSAPRIIPKSTPSPADRTSPSLEEGIIGERRLADEKARPADKPARVAGDARRQNRSADKPDDNARRDAADITIAAAPPPAAAKNETAAKKESETKLKTTGKLARKQVAGRTERNRKLKSGSDKDAPAVIVPTVRTKRIGGKTFNMKKGVWYDSAYDGRSLNTVKRKTSAYRGLDSGLRSITDKLAGTVVILWKTKAYKIE